uniref:Uncharacterized protein n=1 Tax=Strigamia maritima TaxID=126957 RepID=T1INQ0_STRMM
MAERFKHDPAIPRVKITRQDLKDGLENTNSKSKDGDRNTTKNIKYGSQPYKPGEGTLRKREIEIKLENENILEKSGNSSKNERKSKNRRPDQKIYQVKKATEGRNSVELKIDECLVVDNHEKKEKFKGGISNKCRNALIQKPSVCLFGIEDEKVSKKTENSNLVNSRVKNGVFDGENGARQADRRGRPYRTRSMCSRSSNERCEEPLEKTLENGLKISNETSSTTSWADEMEREDEQKNLQKPLKPEAKHHNTTPKPEPKYIKPEPKYPITKSHRPHTEKRFDRKPLTNGTTDRISPDGKPEPKTPILDETEQNDHQNSDQSSLFEMADVESCSSPPKNPKRKIKTKKRRPKSESSTDEKSPAKNADRREKNNQNTSKGGGILHLPTGRPPSAPMQPTMVFTGNLYNPNNPAQPKAVYRPIQGDQRHEVPVHAAIGSCYSEHGRGSSNTYNNFAYQQHPEPMNWRVRGPDGGSMNMSKSAFINKNMFEATQCEQDIGRILSMSFERMDLISLNSSRFAVQMRYETIILQDIEYSAEVNIEQLLWKAVFYQVIEAFRKQMVDNPSFKEKIKQTMLQIIDEAVLFYESLLEKLQEKYGFNLSIFLDCEVAVRPKMQVLVKKALMSAQKMIISLGDLARYKELANETLNYKKAKNLYLKAQQLAPKNGRPYNQLAILALYERRKLDAVYYYMRSLSASNPFLSAKEGLNQVFDDAKKKPLKAILYEQVEKLRLECQNAKQVKEKKKDGPEREEVWFLPDGASAINSENSDDDSYDDLGKLSTVD